MSEKPDFDQFTVSAQDRCACAIVNAIDRLTAAVKANTSARLTSPRAIPRHIGGDPADRSK